MELLERCPPEAWRGCVKSSEHTPPNYRDRTGEVLEHLNVLGRSGTDKYGRAIWTVRDHKLGIEKRMKSHELSRIAKRIELGTGTNE